MIVVQFNRHDRFTVNASAHYRLDALVPMDLRAPKVFKVDQANRVIVVKTVYLASAVDQAHRG